MPKSRIILALGFFIALLPILGFRHSWESFFQVVSGLLIVLLSVLISVDRRLTLKAKAEKRAHRKRVLATPSITEEVVMPEPEFVPEPMLEPEPTPEPVAFVEPAPISTPTTRAPRQRRVADRKLAVRDGDAAAAPEFDIMDTE